MPGNRRREKIRPGSGIGSSAASSAAAVFGLNELYGRPFPSRSWSLSQWKVKN
ncbi:MAG: hypothetical protein ACLR1G_16155 [Alistipes indistinctus]